MTTPHAELLRECPFCGDAPRQGLLDKRSDKSRMIFCDTCQYWLYQETWNRRAAPTVEGKWVPVPSREMLLAGLIAMHHCKVGTPFSAFAVSETREVENIYRAMLAAISSAPQQASGKLREGE